MVYQHLNSVYTFDENSIVGQLFPHVGLNWIFRLPIEVTNSKKKWFQTYKK